MNYQFTERGYQKLRNYFIDMYEAEDYADAAIQEFEIKNLKISEINYLELESAFETIEDPDFNIDVEFEISPI